MRRSLNANRMRLGKSRTDLRVTSRSFQLLTSISSLQLLLSLLHPSAAMAPHPGSDADYFRNKARRDLLTLLEGVSKAAYLNPPVSIVSR